MLNETSYHGAGAINAFVLYAKNKPPIKGGFIVD